MTSILFFIAGIALGFYIKSKITKPFTPKQAEELKEMREDAREALTERTEKRKEKILSFMKSEALHQKELEECAEPDTKSQGEAKEQRKVGVTRADIEKLLDVSGGTAIKYLNELESENKIKQIGDRGRDVYYTLNA